MAGYGGWLEGEALAPCPPFEDPRDCLLRGVHVLTVRAGDRTNGMAVASVIQACHEPSLLSVAVAVQQYTHELLLTAQYFAICSLRVDQHSVARLFGESSGRSEDKLKQVPVRIGKTGVPLLVDCLAYFECRRYRTILLGDHTLLLGEVVDAAIVSKGKQLPYSRFDYPSQSAIRYRKPSRDAQLEALGRRLEGEGVDR